MRNAYFCAVRVFNLNLVFLVMLQSAAPIFPCPNHQVPHAILISHSMELFSIPVIEISKLLE